jgi:hypothetical protein
MIPIIISVRGVILASIIVLGLGVSTVLNNSKNMSEYANSTGIIEYFSTEFQNLPIRNKGDFRYLKVSTYPYLFEIYAPSNEQPELAIDNLEVGDKIDVYYYETSDTRNSRLNRYTQFINKEGKSHYIRNGFQKQLGIVVIGLSLFLIIIAYIFWNKGKLKW